MALLRRVLGSTSRDAVRMHTPSPAVGLARLSFVGLERSASPASGTSAGNGSGFFFFGKGSMGFSASPYSSSSGLQDATQAQDASRTKDVRVYEYVAPFGGALKRVKILSVCSLCATFTSLPVMLYLQGGFQLSGRIGAVMTVGFFSLFTTGMLHWFSSPYICAFRHGEGSEAVEVETCTLLGQKRIRKFKFEEMEAPEGSLRPLITFEVGEDRQPFYIDERNLSYEPFLERIPAEAESGVGEEGSTGMPEDHAKQQ
ncbi:hypothetical protein HOP50_01g05410 [Chloropicon primus]|uniref:Uncharacterized protein n=1 Tax=Chloropicon primus TaxID=1764295 RepID=A0A5B8MEF5_9CHLO|nr:hypothetical protein A3770_01p05530 [Chloropicon primus]UPQ97250.1 hypothetical protein HOP50_01g05410 [Chloropicon primus]|eukprot:QDZ18035.1 hypothetical protein A3770_01p05530 [Chloropicon primus]